MKTDTPVTALHQCYLAFSLLSRIPVPRLPDAVFAHTARAVWAYPVVGWVVAGLAVLTGNIGLGIGLAPTVAAGLALAVSIIVTGAMHEDGLADTTDGFWGGHCAEQRLTIMKDSQIGSYGVLALVLVTGLRWVCYAGLLAAAPLSIVAAAGLSRGVMPVVMYALPHARETGLSRSVGKPAPRAAAIAVGLAAALACSTVGLLALGLILIAGVVAIAVTALARRKIGGQTGDVLGATQQVSETLMLIALSASLA